MRIFPDAKVVLTIRDPEKWYESVKGTIYQSRLRLSGSTGLFLKLVGFFRLCNTATMCSNQGFPITEMGLFDAIESGKEDSIKFYNDWVEHVKKTVPSKRLLVFESKQGWAPLCSFLDLPIPNELFPHVNDAEARRWSEKKLVILSHAIMYVIPGIVLIIALLIAYMF